MPAPTWESPTPGQATRVGHVNQFLGVHASTFTYQGSKLVVDPTIGLTADQLGAGALAYKFTLGTSATLSRVDLALGGVGAGADTLISLQADNGSGAPTGVPLVSAVVPAEWLIGGVQSALSTFSVPLPYSLAALTPYYVVLQPACQLAGGAVLGSGLWGATASYDDVELTRSTAGTGALTYNPSTRAWSSQNYGYSIGLRGGAGGVLRVVADDPFASLAWTQPAKITSYVWSGSQMTNVFTWTARNLSAPVNLLSRDDAAFVSAVGSWAAITNCSIARSTAAYLYAPASMAVTAAGSGSVLAQSSRAAFPATYYPVTASTTYTALASFLASTTGRNCSVTISFYTSAGALISSATGTAVSDTTTGWTLATVSTTSPSNAAYASVAIGIAGCAASEVHYVDEVQLQLGTGTVWSYPGVGVASTRALAWSSGVLTGMS
jgi:hypothetical protein